MFDSYMLMEFMNFTGDHLLIELLWELLLLLVVLYLEHKRVMKG